MQKDSREPPPHWPWSYRIEWRVMRLEEKVHGKETTDQHDKSPSWTPRDFMLALAGIGMVIATLAEKAGLTAVFSTLLAAYGSK